MKTVIRVTEGGRPSSISLANETAVADVSELTKRCYTEPWIRLMRDTIDDQGVHIKTELGVFGFDRDEFMIVWKEVKKVDGAPSPLLTDIAPLKSYLVWEK